MKRWIAWGAAVLVPLGWWLATAPAAEPETTIKQVMDRAHKRGLMKRVAGGNATAEEKQRLLALYEGLAANRPPRGDREDWRRRTTALVDAARAAVDGNPKAGAMLQKAADCRACHAAHKRT